MADTNTPASNTPGADLHARHANAPSDGRAPAPAETLRVTADASAPRRLIPPDSTTDGPQARGGVTDSTTSAESDRGGSTPAHHDGDLEVVDAVALWQYRRAMRAALASLSAAPLDPGAAQQVRAALAGQSRAVAARARLSDRHDGHHDSDQDGDHDGGPAGVDA